MSAVTVRLSIESAGVRGGSQVPGQYRGTVVVERRFVIDRPGEAELAVLDRLVTEALQAVRLQLGERDH